MKTLITGARGFLGRNFIEQFGLNSDTYILVRQPQEYPSGAITVVGDIHSEDSLNVIRKERFGQVINFAWEGLPDLTPENNSKNIRDQLRFLGALCETDCRIINIGSCLEYGNQIGRVFEGQISTKVSDFGLAKSIIREFLEKRGANFAWVRVFYAFGPYQHRGSILNYLNNGYRNGKQPEISNPLLAHDFISSGTIAKIILGIWRNNELQGVFNAGSGKLTSLGALANELARQMNVSFRYEEDENPLGMYADISKLPASVHIEAISDGISAFLASKVNESD
jgi:nucleoside-diphosphate-sugar epimerase